MALRPETGPSGSQILARSTCVRLMARPRREVGEETLDAEAVVEPGKAKLAPGGPHSLSLASVQAERALDRGREAGRVGGRGGEPGHAVNDLFSEPAGGGGHHRAGTSGVNPPGGA